MRKSSLSRKEDSTKWAHLYREWKGNGQKQRAFCEEKGISYWTFKDQIKILRRKGELKSAAKMGEFVPVKIKAEADTADKDQEGQAYCEIRFGTGGRVIIEDRKALDGLGQIVGAMSQ